MFLFCFVLLNSCHCEFITNERKGPEICVYTFMQSSAWWVGVFSFPFWQRLSSDIPPWVSCLLRRWSSDGVQDSLKGSDFLRSSRLPPLFNGWKVPPEIKTLSLFSSFIFRSNSPSAPHALQVFTAPLVQCVYHLSAHPWASTCLQLSPFEQPPASSDQLVSLTGPQCSDHHAPPQLAVWPSCSPASTAVAVYFRATYFTPIL